MLQVGASAVAVAAVPPALQFAFRPCLLGVPVAVPVFTGAGPDGAVLRVVRT